MFLERMSGLFTHTRAIAVEIASGQTSIIILSGDLRQLITNLKEKNKQASSFINFCLRTTKYIIM